MYLFNFCLSIYSEFSKHLITDHENSESSERDGLRQRFSVASHPTLPLLACSDGYTFTLLKFSSKHGLLDTVKSLVSYSRKELEMEEVEHLSHHDETRLSEGQGREDSSRLDFCDFVAALDVGQEESLGGGTVLASHPSLGGGDVGFLDRYLRSVEAGHIEFAGENSGRAGCDAGSSAVSKRSEDALRLALSCLQAAMGLLLSCDPFIPCRGTLPSSRSPNLEQVEANKLELHRVATLLVSTTFKVLSQVSQLSAFSSSPLPPKMVSLSHGFISSLLKLIVLDGIYQAHTTLSFSLANAVFMAFLSGLTKKHCNFERLDNDKHTVASMLEYTCFVGKGIHDFSNLLEDMLPILLSTYDVHPSIFGEVLKTPPHASNLSSDCVLYLGSALKAALKLIGSLLKGMKLCCKLSSSARCSPSKHHIPYLSSESMVRNLRNTTKNVRGTLKSLQDYIRCLLQSYSCRMSHLSSGKVTTRSSGKPITYSPTISNKRKKFLESLLRYDLHTAMELVSSCLKEHEEEEEEAGRGEEDRVTGGSRVVVSPSSSEVLSDNLSSSSTWSQTGLTSSSLVRIESDADRFIVGTLGDLMASYFTNQKLLLSLSSNDCCSAARQVELSRTKVIKSLKDGNVQELWTVERALSFLLLSDKWERACDFVIELGEWRKAFVLSAVSSLHHKFLLAGVKDCETTSHAYFSNLSRHLALSHILEVIGSVFKKQDRDKFWKYDLDGARSSKSCVSLKIGESFLCETFRVCMMVRLEDVLLSTADRCLSEMVEVCGGLSTSVPAGLYLPAPPLYCTQPTITEQVIITQCHLA